MVFPGHDLVVDDFLADLADAVGQPRRGPRRRPRLRGHRLSEQGAGETRRRCDPGRRRLTPLRTRQGAGRGRRPGRWCSGCATPCVGAGVDPASWSSVATARRSEALGLGLDPGPMARRGPARWADHRAGGGGGAVGARARLRPAPTCSPRRWSRSSPPARPARADVVVPVCAGRRQTLAAAYRRSALADLSTRWDEGERSVRGALAAPRRARARRSRRSGAAAPSPTTTRPRTAAG